eukprot:Protomagalhaensia_wolfi_Nauph_80__1525@NODE_192_length_3230_cov_101_865559_g145_i0_p3_GENE_NODE_192_length_3230_cov_101_865559_g145_i0NODE_192_length_3230_cov_101_865559_g145_i0_p3_ORF_typecomplete_len201_score37_07Syntaxin6_N/PF09177_11/6_9e05Syntaxin6_N/PF09177_11/2_5e03Sec20/PF03908_13/2_9e02Sec20/PF03908_13/0_012DUF4419/PF14388_6/3_8e03DUF4419/PF14388_6/0_016DUF5126/PF17166_4/0_019CDC37_M/PF08565_11/2_9CDC37_M/PF08565_11/2_3e03CDC37_M/PF08565_11/3_9TPR_10/PF13374_6/0_76TPR_10/PF13374_6/2_2e0
MMHSPNEEPDSLDSLSRDMGQFQENLSVLERAVEASKRNPKAFNLTDNDVKARQVFIHDSKQAFNRLQERLYILMNKIRKSQQNLLLGSLTTQQKDAETVFIKNETQQQLAIEIDKDRRLQDIARVAERLTEQAHVINQELHEQAVIMSEFETEVEDQTGVVNQVVQRMGIVLKTNNRRQIKQVLYLLGAFVVLLGLLLL